MKILSSQLEPLQQWLEKLEKRERLLVVYGGIFLIFIVLYAAIWEPIIGGLELEKSRNQSQQQLLSWMQESAQQVKVYQSTSGGNAVNQFKNQSVSSLTERSARSMSVKSYISKLESTKKGVKVELKAASFDQIIYWLNDLQKKYGIQASSIKIEPQDANGMVDARITLERL